MDEKSCEFVLSEHGPLAKAVKGFQPRQAQLDLAESIEQVIETKSTLIAEAGTGTGKTFAYLIPTILSKAKTIISTGTKNLQDQLFHRDIPIVRKALGIPIKIALLKGRSNYLCKYRMEMIPKSKKGLSLSILTEIEKIKSLANISSFGEISEITDIDESSQVWPYVTSTNDNCLGQTCSFAKTCFINKARRKALDADLIVVNHHLLFADLALKKSDYGELLPRADCIIVDEAHQLPEIASNSYGERISSRMLTELTKDLHIEYLANAQDVKQLEELALELEKNTLAMRVNMGEAGQREAFKVIAEHQAFIDACAALKENLDELCEVLKLNHERSMGLERLWERALDIQRKIENLTKPCDSKFIHWFETYARSFSIYTTPLSIAEPFQEDVKNMQSGWVFTSATIACNSDFSHYMQQTGLNDAKTLSLDSPFDYQKQSLLFIPRNLPDPNAFDYTSQLTQTAIPVINSSKGRAFFLFTSYNALQIAAKELENQIEYPILIQGSKPKDQLINEFRKLGNAVLLGTSSFWEGVDVRGEALSLVIIDKLPFVVPNDPVLESRAQAIRDQGGDPFRDQQIPQAIISLKQGAGRLIRGISDHGVLMIGDQRLVAKDYGRRFIASLPNMRRTREISKVAEFFKSIPE